MVPESGKSFLLLLGTHGKITTILAVLAGAARFAPAFHRRGHDYSRGREREEGALHVRN
jgi:hypothetical protein